MALGLDLNNLLGTVTDTLDDVLGPGLGDLVDSISPGDLTTDLGDTLNGLLSGGSTSLLDDILSNGLLDLADLQNIMDGGTLNLGSLDDLLATANINDLSDTIDNVFDTPLLGLLPTVVNDSAVTDLSPVELDATIRFVTGLAGTIIGSTGTGVEIDAILENLLLGDDDLRGDGSADGVQGRAGNDTIDGLGGSDVLDGGVGDDLIFGRAGNDLLIGGDGRDRMAGGDGQDKLDGGRGSDAMRGGSGNDAYVVNSANDTVLEFVDEGIDKVLSSVSYTLDANVEQLALRGSLNLNGFGNGLDNAIDGNAGDNVLSGGGGVDVLYGGLGKDRLSGGQGNDIFEYQAINVGEIGPNDRDVILDFTRGDKIKFTAIDGDLAAENNQALRFVGTGDFVANGKGQVSYSVGTGLTMINVDIDGSGAVDFKIELSGTHALSASDFFL